MSVSLWAWKIFNELWVAGSPGNRQRPQALYGLIGPAQTVAGTGLLVKGTVRSISIKDAFLKILKFFQKNLEVNCGTQIG